MDKRERVLSMGYLVKSPTKNKDKANFSRFWKLRWCVFVEIIYKSQLDSSEDKKLVFYYYKDKDSHQKDESAKGQLLISSCKSIKSCYQSQAGFDHLFKIECSDGRFVKFSSPSCQTKFRWITILYNHKFNTDIKQGMCSPHAVQQSSPRRKWSAGGMSRMSGCFEDMISVQQRVENSPMTASLNYQSGSMYKEPRRDSGRFSIDLSPHEEAPPLPPRRDSYNVESLSNLLEDQISICSKISDDLDMQSSIQADQSRPRKSSFNEDREFGMLQIFNDLFMLCEVCQNETGSGRKGTGPRRRGSKNNKMKNVMDKHEELTEVDYDRFQVSGKGPEFDSVSRDTVSSEESNSGDVEAPYSVIGEVWLEEVREKTAQLEDAAMKEDEKDTAERTSETEEHEVTPKEITENLDQNVEYKDECIYEVMNKFSSNPPETQADERETIDAIDSKNETIQPTNERNDTASRNEASVESLREDESQIRSKKEIVCQSFNAENRALEIEAAVNSNNNNKSYNENNSVDEDLKNLFKLHQIEASNADENESESRRTTKVVFQMTM